MCFYCLKNYVDFQELRNHTFEEHKPLEVIKLRPRLALKVDVTDLKCTLCSKPMKDIRTLTNHLIRIHNKRYNSNFKDGVIPFRMVKVDDNYECYFCNEKFLSFYNLNRHINKHYDDFVCQYCAQCFVTVDRLRSHLASHVSGEYPCDVCGKKFVSNLKLKDHMNRLHLKNSRLKCPKCPEKFIEHHVKVKHMKEIHDIVIEIKCEECKLVFESRRAHTKHMQKTHLPQFICDICGRSYIQKGLLKIHQLAVHSDGPNFTCNVCNKSYKRKCTLRKHMKVHNRLYKCEKCKNDFDSKRACDIHVKLCNNSNFVM